MLLLPRTPFGKLIALVPGLPSSSFWRRGKEKNKEREERGKGRLRKGKRGELVQKGGLCWICPP